MYSAVVIAKSFLDKAKQSGKSLTPMQLQKLVYFAHGWNLAIADKPLLDEQIEAWRYGPVIPSLYHRYKKFGAGEIALEGDEGEVSTEVDKETCQLIDRIWEVYGEFNGARLSAMTHRDGTPWEKTIRKYGGELPKGTDIQQDLIREYFETQGHRSASQAVASS